MVNTLINSTDGLRGFVSALEQNVRKSNLRFFECHYVITGGIFIKRLWVDVKLNSASIATAPITIEAHLTTLARKNHYSNLFIELFTEFETFLRLLTSKFGISTKKYVGKRENWKMTFPSQKGLTWDLEFFHMLHFWQKISNFTPFFPTLPSVTWQWFTYRSREKIFSFPKVSLVGL